jgi:hypothetical protein
MGWKIELKKIELPSNEQKLERWKEEKTFSCMEVELSLRQLDFYAFKANEFCLPPFPAQQCSEIYL